MKKMILFFTSLTFIAACKPKDIEVINDAQRAKLNQKNQDRSGKPSASSLVKIGSFGAAAFMVEKQGEIIQLLATSGLNRAQTLGPYLVDEASDSSQQLQKVIISAKDFTVDMSQYTTSQSSQWNTIIERDSAGALLNVFSRSIGENGNLQKLVSKSGENGSAVTLTEKSAELSLVRAKDDANYGDVTYTADGTMEIRKDGITETMPYQIRVKMRIKPAQLKESVVEITNTDISLDMPRPSYSIAAVVKSDKDAVLTFKNENGCPAISGKATLVSDKKKPVVIFDEKGSVVLTAKSPYEACGQRPTVDLSRILVY